MHAPRRRLIVPVLLGVATVFVAVLARSASGEAPGGSRELALVGGHILTQTDAGSIDGTILIRDGKIIAVGPTLTIPASAERLDVTGLTVTPGLIDARSSLWLNPATIRESAADGGLDVLDGVDPHEEDWREVIGQGVTAV